MIMICLVMVCATDLGHVHKLCNVFEGCSKKFYYHLDSRNWFGGEGFKKSRSSVLCKPSPYNDSSLGEETRKN